MDAYFAARFFFAATAFFAADAAVRRFGARFFPRVFFTGVRFVAAFPALAPPTRSGKAVPPVDRFHSS